MKVRKMLILSIVLLLLSGCAKKSSLAAEYGYRCYESNGQYYITMDVELGAEDVNGGTSLRLYYIKFQDFEEMISDFKNGNFTELEWMKLKDNMVYCYEKNLLPIVDFDNLLQPVYPEGYYLSSVLCTGPDLRVILDNQSDALGSVDVYYEEYMGGSKFWFMHVDPERRIEFYKSEGRVEVEYEEDRNATVVKKYSIPHYAGSTYVPESLEKTSCFYSFTKDNIVYYVCEEYNGNEEKIKDVTLIVQDGDDIMYFNIYLNERPSIEFLSQFGFEPYKKQRAGIYTAAI